MTGDPAPTGGKGEPWHKRRHYSRRVIQYGYLNESPFSSQNLQVLHAEFALRMRCFLEFPLFYFMTSFSGSLCSLNLSAAVVFKMII